MFSCVSETANPRVQSLSTNTPPCALPKRGINITSLSSLSLLVFSKQLPKLLSSISSCYMTSYGYTPPNSTSRWRDGELKFLYHMGISQSVSVK